MTEPLTSDHWIKDRASFLEFLGQQSERWEFFAFVVKAMVGGTANHNTLVKNIAGLLDDEVGEGPCRVFLDGMRLEPEHNQDVTFPDAMVVCEPVPGTATAVSRPTVIVEVLSSSTEWESRGPKWSGYQGIPTLRHYVLVSQEQPAVEVFSRTEASAEWTFRKLRGPGAVLELQAIDARVPLDRIYRGTDVD